ncbi:MAG TPA: hypothetical protein VIK26_00910 [Clostridium sp.]
MGQVIRLGNLTFWKSRSFVIAYLSLIKATTFEDALYMATIMSIINISLFVILREKKVKSLIVKERNKLSSKMRDKIGNVLSTSLMQLRHP